ncbi:KH domain-containing protein At4g18375 [Linum grandiflorum]
MPSDDENENGVVTVRLLVPNNMVGCILGKGGDVIKRLRTETDAKIRIFPPEQLPSCAMSTDELLQISGKADVVRRALFEVSTLLHQNPRKGEHVGGQSLYPPRGPINNMLPPEQPMWPRRSSPDRMLPLPWIGGDEPLRFTPSGFNDVPPRHGDEPSVEFSMKILCAVGKIGGVIGKGGSNVKFIQQETGASIHVEDAPSELDERAIRVCAIEALWNPRSQTIEAILQLQSKTSEISEKGTITTRLLVPSNKVGCILGQGGQVINEMRKRTLADIRIFSKDEKPKCASDDEDVIQISGNASVSKDALAEIASRLRVRTLRDTNAGAEPRPIGPSLGFDPGRNLPGGRTFSSGPTRASSSSGYEPVLRGGARDYEPPSYQIPPRYRHANNGFEHSVSSNRANSDVFTGGSLGSNVHQVPGWRTRIQDAQFDGSRPEHFGGTGQSYMTHDINGGQHQRSFQQSSYPPSQQRYTGMNGHDNIQVQPSGYRNYLNAGGQQSPYQNQFTPAHQPPGAAYCSQQGGYQRY